MGLEEFRNYCSTNNGRGDYSRGEESPEHRKLVHSIASNPHNYISGIGRVIQSYEEVQLIDKKDWKTISAIDVVFFTHNDEAAICEVKVSDKYEKRAFIQLTKQYEFLKTNFGLAVKRICLQKKSNGKILQTIIQPNIKDLLHLYVN